MVKHVVHVILVITLCAFIAMFEDKQARMVKKKRRAQMVKQGPTWFAKEKRDLYVGFSTSWCPEGTVVQPLLHRNFTVMKVWKRSNFVRKMALEGGESEKLGFEEGKKWKGGKIFSFYKPEDN